MKARKTIAIVATVLIGTGLSSYAQGIAGSKHDFSGAAWNASQEICLPCHTTHNTSAGAAPLWNHATTASTFTPYSSSTLDATDVGQPSASSLACLSCHDGTVALDSFGGVTGTILMGTINGGVADLGINLGNDHPVSFTYNTALAGNDSGLYDPSVDTTPLGGTIAADLLFGDQLECASCHDVHNDAGNTSLLTIDNAGSALCLTCHNK